MLIRTAHQTYAGPPLAADQAKKHACLWRGVRGRLGGALVIAGSPLHSFWSVLLGVIIGLVGLVAFGGFAKGKWY